jgi:hypothetical protein
MVYQILVATEPERLVEHDADIWDSGVVASNQSADIHCRMAESAVVLKVSRGSLGSAKVPS